MYCPTVVEMSGAIVTVLGRGPIAAGGDEPEPESLTAIDPPIDSATASKAQLAFGFDQLVEDYAGNTVRLQRASTPTAQQDFGVDTSGRFDLDAVIAWAGANNVTVVKFYDQKGGAKVLAANSATSVAFVTSGLVTRFATDWDPATGQLTFSNDDGAVGCSVTGGGYFELTSSGLATASGLAVHSLFAPFTRKKANNSTEPTELNGNSTLEAIWSYQTSATNYFRYLLGNAANTQYAERNSSGGGSQTLTSANSIKANATVIATHLCDGTELSYFSNAKRTATATPSAGNITANGTMTDGTLRVGKNVSSNDYGNFLFGAILITQTLSDAERRDVHMKLEELAYQHRLIDEATGEATLFGSSAAIMDFTRYANASTGQTEDRNQHFTINWNTDYIGSEAITGITKANPAVVTSAGHDRETGDRVYITGVAGMTEVNGNVYTVTKLDANTFSLGVNSTGYGTYTSGGTHASAPNMDFAYTLPLWDLQGIRRMGTTAWANAFRASNTWFADQHKGTFITVAYRETGGQLCQWWSSGTNTTPKDTSGTNTNYSMGQGYHHSQPGFYRRVANSIDTGNISSNPPWSDDVGGKISQSLGKYSLITPNGCLDNRETVAITGITQANPAVVTCVSHGRSTGNKVWVSGVAGMTQVNGAEYTITKIGNDSFSIGVDSTGWGAYTSGGTIKYTTDSNWTYNGQTFNAGTAVDWDLLDTWIDRTPSTPEDANYHNWTTKYPFDNGYLEIQIATVDPGIQYNPASPDTAYMRTGTCWNYVGPLFGKPFGHIDRSIARQEGSASILHSDPASYIQSMNYLNTPNGTWLLSVWIPNVAYSLEQAEQAKLFLMRKLRNGWNDSAPVNTVAPAITGTARVDETLTCAHGTWTGSPTPTYAYQWKRDGVNIGSATASTYQLVSADQTKTITCTVTAHNLIGDATATASGVGPVGASVAPPVNTVAPVISGNLPQGQTLTTTDGTWTGAPTISYSYQWKRGGVNISGETNNTYATQIADIGANITCAVTGTNSNGNATATSNSLGPITAALPAPTTDWKFDDASGTTITDAKGVVNGTFAGAPTWGSGYASQSGGANTGYADSSANAAHYTSQPWSMSAWVLLNASPAVQLDVSAIGTNASTLAANRAMWTQLNIGATSLIFNITDASSADSTLTVTGLGLDTTNKALIVLTYDPTGGAGASVMKAYVYEEGTGLVNSGTKTDANVMRQNSAFKLCDRRSAAGSGSNVKTYRRTFWANRVLTSQEIADIYTAGSESTAY